MPLYMIKYISDKTSKECIDTESANNQIAAYNRFIERKPWAKYVRIKSQTGVWINHYLE